MKKQHLVILILTVILFLPVTTWAAVTLKYFRAETPDPNKVHLVWETATELEHAAFILSRADEGSNQYQELKTFPAEGDAVSGAIYQYDDVNVTPGRSCTYKLEDMDNNGDISLAQQPITVSLSGNGAPEDTPTPASTTAPTPTTAATATADSASATPTSAPAATNTPEAKNNTQNENGATPEAIATTSAEQNAQTPADNPAEATATPATVAGNQPVTFPTPSGANQPPGASRGSSNILLYLGLAALIAALALGVVVMRMWRGQKG